jgi:CheY-like chemotaxis protein
MNKETASAVRVLVVEDQPDLMEVFITLLEMDGALVLKASNYNEALEIAENNEIDIVLTDFRMPGMHGLYLLDMIKHKHPDMPVILMTAYLDDALAANARRLGVDYILAKPFEYSELFKAIRKLLRKKWQE